MFSFCIFILLLMTSFGLFYVYLVWNFGYWRKRGIKEAKSYPFVGTYPSLFTARRNVVYDIDDLYRKYKRDENFVGTFNTRVPQLLITSLDYVQKIFVNDFKCFHDNEFSRILEKELVFSNNPFTISGEEWKRRRAEISPGLTTSRVKCVYPVTKVVCKKFCEYLHKQCQMATKDGLDARDFSLRFSIEIVSDCVLGIKADSFTEKPTQVYDVIQKVYAESPFFFVYTALSIMMPILQRIHNVPFFSKKTENFFLELVNAAIEMRRKSENSKREDFLQHILDLQDKKNLSLAEATSHSVTFIIDGYETSATALAHTFLLLARYPEAQEKLRNEIESAGDMTFEVLSELPYLDACIHDKKIIMFRAKQYFSINQKLLWTRLEATRIFSPQLVASKLCTQPYEFVNKNGTKLRIEPGTVVQVPVYSLHHDPDIFPNPEEFVPERFLPEAGGAKKYREMGAYLAFGSGPRVCMGMRFALTQMKAVIVEVLKQFNIKVNPRTRKDNYLNETFFMSLLKDGIWLDLEPRN